MSAGSSGRWGVGGALSDRLRAGHACPDRLGRRCDVVGVTDRRQASRFLTRRKHEAHGGPRRKKIWRFARSAFTRFRPDSCFIGLYCPELDPSSGGRARSDAVGTSDRWQASKFLTRGWPAGCARTAIGESGSSAPPHKRPCPAKEAFSTTDARRCTQTQTLIRVHLRASVVDFSCSPTVRSSVADYFHGSEHEDHGGPRRRKKWRFPRSAFTRFRPVSCSVAFYCSELMTPRQFSGGAAVFSGFLRGPPWSSCFLRVKVWLACLQGRRPRLSISWPGPVSHTSPGSHTRPAATPGMGECRGAPA
jgi:hypothetical protein